MADINDPHFDKTFWFIVGSSFFVFTYIFTITFLQIPKDNQRFADTILGFLLGTVLSGGTAYLTGGNPVSSIRKPSSSGNTTAEISATITSENKDEKDSKI